MCIRDRFSTLSWSLSRSLRPPKPRYYRNLFLLGQLKSRLGSGAKTMGVITVVLTAALVCFTLLPLLAVRIQGYQQVLSVYEVQVGTIYTAQEDALPTGPLDDQFLTDTLNQGGYPVTGTASGALYLLRREDLKCKDRDLPCLLYTSCSTAFSPCPAPTTRPPSPARSIWSFWSAGCRWPSPDVYKRQIQC